MSITDKLNQLKEIKADIKSALIEKGAEVTSSTPFGNYAEIIENLETGGGVDNSKQQETITRVIREEVRAVIQNPIMTDYTINGWTCFANYEYIQGSEQCRAYKAFNKNMTNEDAWYTGNITTVPFIVGLIFPENYKIESVDIMNEVATSVNFKNGLIQFRTSSTAEWETLYEITNRQNATGYNAKYVINNDTAYKEFRLYITAFYSGSYGNGTSLQNININYYGGEVL